MERKANYAIKDRISYSKGKLIVLNFSEKAYKNDIMAMLFGAEQKG